MLCLQINTKVVFRALNCHGLMFGNLIFMAQLATLDLQQLELIPMETN